METRAMLFIFVGEEPPVELVRDIAGMIAGCCNTTGTIDHFEYDSEDIAKAILTAPLASDVIGGLRVQQQMKEHTPEEEAVIYVGTVMKDVLGVKFTPEDFVAALTKKISECRNSHTEEAKRFMNSLFILSQEGLVISQSILKKYKLNEKKILIIKRVYNLVNGC